MTPSHLPASDRSRDSTDLDPQTPEEWAEFERAARRLLEHTLVEQRTLRDAPAFRPMPAAARAAIAERPSPHGIGVEAALNRALEHIAPYGPGNRSPRFWGWVLGAGNLPGMLGQWLATSMNANVWAGNQAPAWLELEVIGWFRDWFEFPAGSSGLLLDGSSSANTLGLAIARHRATHGEAATRGLAGGVPLSLYCSSETHVSIAKAAQLLGLGQNAVRFVPARSDGRSDVDAIERAIERDRRDGWQPFCVVGSAGTVRTGALDPLGEIADLSARHGLWFHVDGAIGALGYLSPELRPRLAGLPRADSLAFDLHKWGQISYDSGCLLVRDATLHRAAFQTDSEYLGTTPAGLTAQGSPAFNDLGPNLSRGDRALEIWMTFMALGVERMLGVFEQNVAQARWLADSILREPELELLNDVQLNIVCFRYRGADARPGVADRAQEHISLGLQTSGTYVLSPYAHAGQAGLRVALSNHRTRQEDLAALLREVLHHGRAARQTSVGSATQVADSGRSTR